MAVASTFRKLDTCRQCRFRAGHFQDFRPGFGFWRICYVYRHVHFTLKQLRLSLVNEIHTNSYTGPRLQGPGCDVVNYINTKAFIIIPSTNNKCKYKHAYFK